LALVGAEGVERRSDGVSEGGLGSGSGPSQERFDFGEDLLDWAQVR
jgi:hypothetical protein